MPPSYKRLFLIRAAPQTAAVLEKSSHNLTVTELKCIWNTYITRKQMKITRTSGIEQIP